MLSGTCGQASFTLIEASNLVLYAPFIGCINDKPECCPWSQGVLSPVMQKTLTAGSFASKPTITSQAANATTSQSPSPVGLGGGAGAYPAPATMSGGVPGQLALDRCADDYSTVQGGCCPSYVSIRSLTQSNRRWDILLIPSHRGNTL